MLLELKNIEKKFLLPSGSAEITVLRDISLNVSAGETVAIIGPSGSGKSTLLNIIGSLDKPTAGSVLLAGKNIAELDDAELSKTRNLDIGFVFQLHHLLPQCTVLENVLIPTIPYGAAQDRKKTKQTALELLQRVGLEKHADYFPAQLSGGELLRTALVRALINKPKLLLADEPTGSLDRESAEKLGQILFKLNKEEGTTLIVVTHSSDLARLLNKTYLLQDGRLTPWQLTSGNR